MVNALLLYYKKEKEFNEKKFQFYLKKKGQIAANGKNPEKQVFLGKTDNLTLNDFSQNIIRIFYGFAMNLHGFLFKFPQDFNEKIGKLEDFLDKNAGNFIRTSPYIKKLIIISILLIVFILISLSVRLLIKIV